MAQAATSPPPKKSHSASPAPSIPLVPNNAAAGAKRKRVVERKFYAVREGKTPGIYNTWSECLAQVRGHRGALFKAFQSLHEAKAFVDGKLLGQPSSKNPSEQKFYAVQRGKKPGVYTDWPSAQAQISGFKHPKHIHPKHKKFGTRAEAEAFVAADKQKDPSFDPTQTLSPEEEIRRLIVRNSAPGLVTNGTYQPKDKDGNPYELGTGPLPSGAEDGFDPNIKLASDGAIVQKTLEEKTKTKMMIREKDPPSMLRIYTDGSSLRNGQIGARAGVGVFFGPQDPKYEFPEPHPVYTIDWVARGAPPPSKKRQKLTNWRYRNVSEALKGSKQTNQRAELTAIQRALDIAPRHRDVTIYTDSKYSIDCVTSWYRNWEKNGWVNSKGKPVENKDIVIDVREQIEERDTLKKGTYFVWVKGHANDKGNIQADRLAVDGARLGRGVTDEADREADEKSDAGSDSENESTSINGHLNGDSDGGAVDGEELELEDAFEAMERALSEDHDDKID